MKWKLDHLKCLCVIGIIGSFFILPVLSQNIQKRGRRNEVNICPSLSGWEGRSQQLCDFDQSMYHCLLTRDDYYLEVCIRAEFVKPGEFPRISEQLDKLYFEPCPYDSFQPEGEMSNRFKNVKCTYMKAKCDGYGEEYCNHGNTTQDAECRCDYLKGYRSWRYFLTNPEKRSCYTKNIGDDSCIMLPCSNSSEELNPAYQCVPVCPYGYHRPPYEFDCVPNKTTTVKPDLDTTVPSQQTTSTTEPPKTYPPFIPAPKTPSATSKIKHWKIGGIIVSAAFAIILVCLTGYFLMEKYFKIHADFQQVTNAYPNESVLLKAKVPHFSWFDIDYQWKLIRKEDNNEEEMDLPDESRFQTKTEGNSTCLTISSICVQDEAKYVCLANLRCWRRVADKCTTSLIVKGGEFYTPVPSPKLQQKPSPEETPANGKTINIHHSDTTVLGDQIINVYNMNVVKKSKKKKSKRPWSSSSNSSEEQQPFIPMEPLVHKKLSWEEEKEKLDTLAMSKFQITIDDVPGDGDCLYHAFLRNKSIHNLPDSPKELRKKLVKFLESNPDRPDGTSYKDFLCLPRDSDHGILHEEDKAIEKVKNVEDQKQLRWQRFLDGVLGEDWGGSIEIMALAQLYNVAITVLSLAADGWNLYENEFNRTQEALLNPGIFLGHLKENGKGLHFVAFKPLEERTFEELMELPGEQHRKTIDSSFFYRDGDKIYAGKLSDCIGCISSGEDKGTGFRVGSKYVMTAFHVVEDNLKQFWDEVYMRLTEEERHSIHWTEKNIPQDGRWSLTELIQTLRDPEKKEKLEEIGRGSITEKWKIQFGFVENNTEIHHGMFSYDVAFASPSCDVVILELLGDKEKLPKSISLNNTNLTRIQDKLHIIGHPNGMELQIDPGCKIIKKKEDLNKLVKQGIEFFSSRGFTRTEVEEDYQPCVISPDHILFHCSESTAHGASGSPLIVISGDKPQVTGMLLRGHPKLYYNYKRGKGEEELHGLLVESGISMEKVCSLLKEHNLSDLADDLFSH